MGNPPGVPRPDGMCTSSCMFWVNQGVCSSAGLCISFLIRWALMYLSPWVIADFKCFKVQSFKKHIKKNKHWAWNQVHQTQKYKCARGKIVSPHLVSLMWLYGYRDVKKPQKTHTDVVQKVAVTAQYNEEEKKQVQLGVWMKGCSWDREINNCLVCRNWRKWQQRVAC